MATPRAHDEEPVELVAKGTLHKKRGGLGRHTYGVRSSPYVRRYFELTSDGVLSYWDESERRKGGEPRNSLNLLASRAVLSVVSTTAGGGAPAERVLAIAHEQGGARWKLAADSDEARDAWRRALEPYCRASAPRPSADVRAVVPDLPPDLTATRRKALTRSSVATGDRGSTIVALTTFSFVVSVISAIVCSGGAFSVSVLALVHGYALVVLTRRGALDPRPCTSVVKVCEDDSLPPLPEGIDTSTEKKGRPVAGTTIARSDFDVTGGGPPATWSRAPGSTFRVRQVGYKSHGKKAVSAEAFYECVSVDLFDTSSRVPCLADKVELPAPERVSPDSDIPSLFIVVAHIPSETGPMSVGPDADGLIRRPFLESRRTRRGDGVEVTPSTRRLLDRGDGVEVYDRSRDGSTTPSTRELERADRRSPAEYQHRPRLPDVHRVSAHGADGPRPLFIKGRWFMRAGSLAQATQEVVFRRAGGAVRGTQGVRPLQSTSASPEY
jgi:hypothetical protein